MLKSHRLFFAAAVAIPLGLLALAGWLNFRQLEGEAIRNVRQTTTALSEHALRTLHAQQHIIEVVDHYVEGWSWQDIMASQDLNRLLVRLAAGSPDIASIFLLDRAGQGWMSSRRFPMPPIDGSDRDYYLALRDGAQQYVSRPALSRLSHERFFTLAQRRTSAGGKFDGLIAVSVNPVYFESFYATLLENPQDAAGFARSDGVILVRYPRLPEGGSGVIPPGSELMRGIAEGRIEGDYIARSAGDGIERVHAYRQIGNYPVFASFQLSMHSVWRAWRWAMLPYALASMLVMGILLVGAALAEQRARRAAAEARGREAEQASRAKDLFVAALSHELRNPLAAISNASEALQRDPGSRAAVDIIARQIGQLRRMLDDLLDTARAVYGKLRLERRRVDLRAIAEATVAEQYARSKVRASIRLSGAEPWVDGDPVRLKQMLDNLVENAIKYGGRRIEILLDAQGDRVQLAVKDDGQGIPAELLARLFQPFVQGEQTLERAQGGLGLGLALVNRLAALHGGSLSAASEGPGLGSTFTLRLPRADAPARPVEIAPPGVQAARQRLLLVDDEPDARESLRALLELDGHQVTVAADGRAALELLESARPGVALIDIGLPGIDGYELARRLRARAPEVALIAVTGYGQPQDREKARAAGFEAHLTKPFSLQELSRLLARTGGRDTAPRTRSA